MIVTAGTGSTYLDFVVDTEAAITIIPKKHAKGMLLLPTAVSLSTANGKPIATYGESNIDFRIPSLRRNSSWTVVIAEITRPLFGLDFLSRYNLFVNCMEGRLNDKVTGKNIKCQDER